MGYLIGQILVFLLLAALVGGAVGWMLRSIRQRARLDAIESRYLERVRVAERERDDFYRHREEMAARLNTVEQENDDRLARIRSLEGRVDAAEKSEAMRAEELTTVRTTLSSVRGDLLESERACEALEERLARYEDRGPAVDPEATEGADEPASEPANEPAVERTPEQASDDTDRDAAPGRVPEAAPESENSAAGVESDPRGGGAAAPDVRPEVRPGWLLGHPQGHADNLKKIRGVGRVLERTMNDLGVFHFRQIAGWTSSDVEWIASHIDIYPDRIERDGWIDQARELDEQKQPGAPR